MLPPLAILAALLLAAVWHDLRARRIPNGLVLPGALAGLALQSLLPPGGGLYGTPFGALGLLSGLAGMAVGLLLLLPMYALGTLGAGDVKLLGMIGSFLGPGEVVGAALLTFLAGGVLSIAVALYMGELRQVMRNVIGMLLQALFWNRNTSLAPPQASTGQFPYAVAIAVGTGLQLSLSINNNWRLLS